MLAFGIWVYWGNTSIQTTRIRVSSEKIPAAFDGFTIVQVSDLHNATFGEHQSRLLEAVRNATPDVIAITGDLIDSNLTDVSKAMEFVHGAVEIAPVYYVTGNHEARSEQYASLQQQMLEAGVVLLRDKSVEIHRENASVQLLGVDDPAFVKSADVSHTTNLDAQLKALLEQRDDYTILLSHRPELFSVYADHHIDLILSGHAHGGQVRLPFVGGLVAPNQGFFPTYSEGMHVNETTHMIVSRGLGNSICPIRINNRPELVVVTLTQKNAN